MTKRLSTYRLLAGTPHIGSRQVINFQNADLILANGAGYAKWLEKVSLPSSKIVNTSGSFKDQWIETDEVLVHSHGPEGAHSHKGTAITTWLNFKFALQQATTVHSAVSKLLPESLDELNKNFEALKVRLSELDARMASASLGLSHLFVAASHPVYQYLEAGYKLSMVSLHWEPDEMPNEEQWDYFSGLVNAHKIKIMLWEDEPTEEIKLKLEELRVKTVVFNPCGNKPGNGDFIEMMNNNIGQLERAIADL